MDNAIRFKFILFNEYVKYHFSEHLEMNCSLLINHSVTICLSYQAASLDMMCSKEDFLVDGFLIAFYIPRMDIVVYKISDFLNHINNFIVPLLIDRERSYKERQDRMDTFRSSQSGKSDDKEMFHERYWKELNRITKEYPLIDCKVFNRLYNKRLEHIKTFYT